VGVLQPSFESIPVKTVRRKRIAVIVRVGLIGVPDVPAVVAGISYPVTICIFLERIFCIFAVVNRIENTITVIII
jgi:hypothetical protein